MYGAHVERPGKPYQRVKNLGWLLRHWRDVEHMRIKTTGTQPAAILTVELRGGVRYVTGWADVEVMLTWLHRPVFLHTTVTIDGVHGVIAHPGAVVYAGHGAYRAVAE